MTQSNNEYQKGYAAGLRSKKSDAAAELKKIKDEQRERVYLRCLEIALTHCGGWSVGGKKISDCEGYSKLAKIFMDNAIDILK